MANSPGSIFIVCSIIIILLASFLTRTSDISAPIVEHQEALIHQLQEEVKRLQLQLASHIAEEQNFLNEQKVQRDGLAEKDNRLEDRIKKMDGEFNTHVVLDNKRHQNEAMEKTGFLEEIRNAEKEVNNLRYEVGNVKNLVEELKSH